MAHETYEQIKQSIYQLKHQIDEAGLPERSPRFVPLPMGWVLFERIKPLINYAVTYARLCDKTNEIIDISDEQMTWIKSHEIDVNLINEVDGDMSTIPISVESIYTKLIRHEEYESAGELVRDLAYFIKHTRPKYGDWNIGMFTYDSRADKAENERLEREAYAEIERLQDEDYFNEEYARLVEQYKEEFE